MEAEEQMEDGKRGNSKRKANRERREWKRRRGNFMNESDGGGNVQKKERATEQLGEKQSDVIPPAGGLSRPEGVSSTLKFHSINVSLSLKFSKHNRFLSFTLITSNRL